MKTGFLAFALSLVAAAAQAADADGRYAVLGTGQSSCNSYNESRAAGSGNDPYKAFVTGYISGYNAFVPETYNLAATRALDDVLGMLDGYCQEKPMDSFEAALHHVTDVLKDSRMKTSPKKAPRWP
jgi:hypothetical protein